LSRANWILRGMRISHQALKRGYVQFTTAPQPGVPCCWACLLDRELWDLSPSDCGRLALRKREGDVLRARVAALPSKKFAYDLVHHHHVVSGAVELADLDADDVAAPVARLREVDSAVVVDPVEQCLRRCIVA
jgi:hypothetical protein